jgi:hypothetical protein
MEQGSLTIRLFLRPYSVRSQMERLLLVLALLSVGLHGWLLYQLIAVRDFHSAVTFLYLFSLLPFSLFLASVWLDHNPGFQRHLTLGTAGVRYRMGFMQREIEFDWEEVERMGLSDTMLTFELKNGESHAVDLHAVHADRILQRLHAELSQVATARAIHFTNKEK